MTNPVFWTSLWNTFYFVIVGGPLSVAVSLAAALLVSSKLVKHQALYRSIYFMPVVTTLVAVAIVWRYLYHPQYGLLNWGLSFFHLPAVDWLGDPRWAKPAIILMAVWKTFGYNMLIFVAGLQAIPEELYEAAHLDGAGAWARFRHVTLPGLKRVMLIALTLDVINTVKYFDLIWVMTAGGPANRTEVLSTLIYRLAFQFFRTGRAAALAMVMVAALAVFSIFYVRLTVRTAAETATG